MRPAPALLAAAALAALALATPAAAQARCVTYYVAAPNAPFTYKAGFDNAKWPRDCDPAGVKISKLYMQDACIDTRANYFPTDAPSCGAAGAAVDTSTATCEAVRDGAPAGTWIDASTVVKPGSSAAATAFDSGNVCTSTSRAFFFIQWDSTLCPGKQPPAPRLVAQTGANYRGPSCKRKGASMTQRAPGTAYRSGDVAASPGHKGGFSFWWGILIAAGILGMCALVAMLARRAAAKPPPTVGAGGGGPAGVQMSGVPPPPPPPGFAAGGPPPPGAYVPGAAPAGAAGAGPAPAGDVKYSFSPSGGAAAGGAAAGGPPPLPGAPAAGGVPLTGATDGGGKPPGTGGGYPKI